VAGEGRQSTRPGTQIRRAARPDRARRLSRSRSLVPAGCWPRPRRHPQNPGPPLGSKRPRSPACLSVSAAGAYPTRPLATAATFIPVRCVAALARQQMPLCVVPTNRTEGDCSSTLGGPGLGYRELLASLASAQTQLQPAGQATRAACLYIAVLVANVLICRICAARRSGVSPAQPGGTRREVPGSDG
jgi:hypothetical protein